MPFLESAGGGLLVIASAVIAAFGMVWMVAAAVAAALGWLD